MFRKLKWPVLIATVFALLTPAAAMAAERRGHEKQRHHSRFSLTVGVGPRPQYFVAPRRGVYAYGYYDRWGYWHPYPNGYYDAWGRWHWVR